mmetsp:Transcript_15751/g.34031  ORF Transcript_15751/g.34031 Transcript_15751/m.34031 type:complete len:128 (-) Transcript_15751:1262-1645(-)
MGERAGFVVFATGCGLLCLYLGWIFCPKEVVIGDFRVNLRLFFPSLYWCAAIPMLLPMLLLFQIVIYFFLNMSRLPDVEDFRTIVDSHGVKRKDVHEEAWRDPKRGTPFINDMSIQQVNQLMFYGRN